MTRLVIDAFASEFARARRSADKAAAQLSWPQLRESLDPQTNSIAVVMKHLAGNLRSRWTDPFTTDGEKPWRNRDSEFIDDFPHRLALEHDWAAGWATLDAALASFTDADLHRTLTIRAEPHTLALALARSACHASYHAGQIVQTARVLASRAGTPWQTITIPRGGSTQFNQIKGLPASGPH
jgi:hypothetical protein